MAAKTKPRLIPPHTPWMISPSTPFLRPPALKSDSQEHTHVKFVAHNQCGDSSSFPSGISPLVVQPPNAFQAAKTDAREPYRILRIVFKGNLGARMYAAHSNSQVIDENIYDWTQVPGGWPRGEDIYAHLERDCVFMATNGCLS